VTTSDVIIWHEKLTDELWHDRDDDDVVFIMQTGATGAVEVGDNMYYYNVLWYIIHVMMIIIEADAVDKYDMIYI